MVMVLDGENNDDVVGDDDVGVGVGDDSVDGGDTPYGCDFFAVTAAAMAFQRSRYHDALVVVAAAMSFSLS